jgi:hypothetical protein
LDERAAGRHPVDDGVVFTPALDAASRDTAGSIVAYRDLRERGAGRLPDAGVAPADRSAAGQERAGENVYEAAD